MVERASSLLAGLTAECSRQRHQLAALRTELSAERDEARQEVVNAEAMFADLHRFVAAFLHSCHTALRGNLGGGKNTAGGLMIVICNVVFTTFSFFVFLCVLMKECRKKQKE